MIPIELHLIIGGFQHFGPRKSTPKKKLSIINQSPVCWIVRMYVIFILSLECTTKEKSGAANYHTLTFSTICLCALASQLGRLEYQHISLP